jgi:cyanophycin synthetase
MSFEPPKSLAILREVCAKEGVAFEFVDTFSGWIARIAKQDKAFLVGAAGFGIYPINRAAPFGVARDKAFTHFLLSGAGFSVPEGEHFFLKERAQYIRPPGRARSDAFEYAESLSSRYHLPLIAKPNAGKGAKLVTFVHNETDLEAAFNAIALEDEIALVQRFIDQPEFRLFLIDGEIVFAYAKSRAEITGDGKTTIADLCAAAKADSASTFVKAQLATRGLTPESRLEAGKTLAVDFVSNISANGRLAGFVEPTASLRSWARRIARTVSLRVTGIDVFSRSRLGEPEDIVVTDVNGSPNLGTLYDLGYRDLVFDVWGTILRKTFDEAWPEGF